MMTRILSLSLLRSQSPARRCAHWLCDTSAARRSRAICPVDNLPPIRAGVDPELASEGFAESGF